jgi:type 1 glutamine amidotransferase
MPSLLYVTQVSPYLTGPAGVHGVLDQSAKAVAELGGMFGLDGVQVADVRDLSLQQLAEAGVLGLFTIGETPWSASQQAMILERVRGGSMAVLAIHAATDSCHGWDEYVKIVGARFDGHPWTQAFDLDVVERDHPATRHLGDTWRWGVDEVYLFRDLRPDARVLLRVADGQLDMNAPDAKQPPCGYPLSWCFEEGKGRVFSSTLGHFPSAWESPPYLEYLHGGLAWALGEA